MKTLTTLARNFVLKTSNAAPIMPRDPHEAADALYLAVEWDEAGDSNGMFACCQSAHDDCVEIDADHVKRIDHYEEQFDIPLRPRTAAQVEQEHRSETEWRWSLRAECPRCEQMTTLTFRPGERAEWQVVEEDK